MVIRNNGDNKKMFGGMSSNHKALSNVVKKKIMEIQLQIAYAQRASVELALPDGTAKVEKVPIAKSARPTNRIPVLTMAKTVLYAVPPPLPHAVRGQRAKRDMGGTMKCVRQVNAKSA